MSTPGWARLAALSRSERGVEIAPSPFLKDNPTRRTTPGSWFGLVAGGRAAARVRIVDDDEQDSVAPSVRRLRQRAIIDRLRESLLFLPIVLLTGGVLLEVAA